MTKPRRPKPLSSQATDRLATTIRRLEDATPKLTTEQRTELLCDIIDSCLTDLKIGTTTPFFGDR